MNLLDEIREHFAMQFKGFRRLNSIDNIYAAETLRMNGEYGVAIPINTDEDVLESFANVRLQTRQVRFDKGVKKYLVLCCEDDDLKYEFAALCTEFVEPGQNGKYRKEILENPVEWWKKWRRLLGNIISEKQVYSVIAEMTIYEYLLKLGKNVKWNGPDGATHDLESNDCVYEIKSSLKKSETVVHISSQEQLDSDVPLMLFYCRMEISDQGFSVNDMVNRLISHGIPKGNLEKKLKKCGLEEGRDIRNEKYRILEGREYEIDEEFPKITKDSFHNGKMPLHISHIEYSINLEGIKYKKMFFE